MNSSAVATNAPMPYNREPLLTAKEEIELARSIQIGQSPDATPLQIKRGDRAKRRMIKANMRLVMVIAHKLWRTHKCSSMTVDDLVQEGTFGLKRAAELFDPTRGYKFSTYAYGWINQALKRAMSCQDRGIRLPLHVQYEVSRYRRASRTLGPSASTAEIVELACVNPKTLVLANSSIGLISLNQLQRDTDGGIEIGDGIATQDDPSFLEELGWNIEDIRAKLLPTLDENERKVICWTYGLNGESEKTLTYMAEQLKVSRQTIVTTKQRALKKLRSVAEHSK
jgi:RNA polymerase sigma factor (sigma-70 family)